jgi:hypothetical protein
LDPKKKRVIEAAAEVVEEQGRDEIAGLPGIGERPGNLWPSRAREGGGP